MSNAPESNKPTVSAKPAKPTKRSKNEWNSAELEFLPQEALEEDIHRFSVFARVSPEHKMRIVKAWQKRGCVVAMTGDGVNDAPVLAQAQVSVAMGGGTDLARNQADIVLLSGRLGSLADGVDRLSRGCLTK